MDNDKYGRTVEKETVGPLDIYTVGADLFTLSYPTGTSEQVVYEAINGMAPPNYVSDQVDPDKQRYKGGIEIGADVSSPLLSLPNDLTNGLPGSYLVGSNAIQVYLNGMRLLLDTDFEEVGSAGAPSNQIQMLIDLKEEDYLEFVQT